ncbi:MAG: glycosyltransferase family 39 protein [Halieaceae bacterium]
MSEALRPAWSTAALAIFAAAIVWVATPNGAGLQPDSIGYIRLARDLAAGASIFELGTHWPPGYPLLLAVGTWVPGAELATARWVCVLSAGVTTIGLGFILRDNLTGRLSGFVLPIVLLGLILSPAFTQIIWQALSEGPFIAALVWAVYAALSFADRQRAGSLLLLCACIGLMSLLRYSFAPFMLAVLLGLLLTARHWHRHWQLLAIAGLLLAALPLLSWLGLSSSAGGPRQFSVHLVGMAHYRELANTFSLWLGFVPASLSIIVFVLSLLPAAVAWWTGRSTVLALCLLMIGGYLAFLLVSISFMDAHTPLDARILSPLLPLWLVMQAVAVGQLSLIPAARHAEAVFLVLLMLIVVAGLGNFSQQLSQAIRFGDGFADQRFRAAPVFSYVDELSPDQTVYTNAGEFFYLFYNRDTRQLPKLYNTQTGMLNPELGPEIESMLAALLETDGVVIWVDALAGRNYLPTVEYLDERLPLDVVTRMNGGTVLKLSDVSSH